MHGKCPKCENICVHLNYATPDIKMPFAGQSWRGIAITCPHCQTILSAAIDPIAIKADIVKELTKKARGY